MRNFPGDEKMQQSGCGVMARLMELHPASVRVFAALGTTHVLAAAAAMFSHNEDLQAELRSAQAVFSRG